MRRMRFLHPVVVAATLVAGSVLVVSLAAQSGSASPGAAPAGWKVPRTADGKPDLQGVWGNNSVTPMTRPTQWKDKSSLTDAEIEAVAGKIVAAAMKLGATLRSYTPGSLIRCRYELPRATRSPGMTGSYGSRTESQYR